MSNRNVRVGELIKREVSDVLHTRYQGDAVSITITHADVSPDHSQAKIFYSVLAEKSKQHKAQKFLDRNAGKIRHELGKRITLKKMPALSFVFDESVERGVYLNELIDSLNIEDEESD